MALVSVIIPVYNVEKYIKRCLNSIMCQSYKDLEILVVDDGSTDNSGDICDDYCKKDPRIKVVHKKNGGLSDARNKGIENALGEYITFLDSDDYVSSDYIEFLYTMLEETGADISVCGYKKTISDNETVSHESSEYTSMTNKEALLCLLYQKKFTSSAWAKMYRKSMFETIRFPLNMLHEDVAIMYRLFQQAKSVVYGERICYFYFQRSGSIVNSNFNKKRMDYVKFTNECMEDMSTISPELYQAALSRHFSACFELLNAIDDIAENSIERDYLCRQIKKYRYKVFRNKNARITNRGAALISMFSINVAIHLSKILIRR